MVFDGDWPEAILYALCRAFRRQFAATLAISSLVVLIGIGGASAQSGNPAPDQGKAATQPADASYPACSRTVTDNCVQTYERGRSPTR